MPAANGLPCPKFAWQKACNTPTPISGIRQSTARLRISMKRTSDIGQPDCASRQNRSVHFPARKTIGARAADTSNHPHRKGAWRVGSHWREAVVPDQRCADERYVYQPGGWQNLRVLQRWRASPRNHLARCCSQKQAGEFPERSAVAKPDKPSTGRSG